MKKSKVYALPLVALSLILASCGGNNGGNTPTSSGKGDSSQTSGNTSQSDFKPDEDAIIPESPTGVLADGAFDFSEYNWKERSKILASLEYYALRNHTAGIPLYDDASYEQFSQRITLPSTKYLTNYGFGTSYGTIKADGLMNDKTIDEPTEKWKSYFHGYTNTDSGTFNAWNSSGSDVSDRSSMITSSYFGVKANADNTSYSWVGSLSQTDAPIMLDEKGNVVSNPDSDVTSKYWRVKVKTGGNLTYHTAATSKWKSKYDGTQVKLADYLTPFKALLMSNMVRTSTLVSDTSGFEGAMDFFYRNDKSKYLDNDAWATSGVGIQLNEEESAIDFTFIQPKSASYARTSLASSLFSPLPEQFLYDIGNGSFTTGTSNYGLIGTSSDASYTDVFDNILILGAYIPEYWQQKVKLVYTANKDYFEASDFHYDGYSEVIFEGTTADEKAYEAFQKNQLDEVTIPLSQLSAHKNDPTVLRTEGSTIIKLNLNTTTAEEWEYYFGKNGTISTHAENNYWSTQALMSNDDFLDGLYYCINRKELADMAGKNPAASYLSSAYMLDPEGVVSYRDSAYGKGVLANFQKAANNEYCYSRSLAQQYFKRAGDALVASGEYEKGETIELVGLYRYQKTIDNLGNYIKGYVEDAFNAANEGSSGLKIKLNLKTAGNNYTDCYTKMDNGEFDLAEGAITGNVLNPLEFMNTLSTNKTLNSGFCLNWGKRTDRLHESGSKDRYAVTYEGRDYSYDALWNASQGFTPVDEGLAIPVGDEAKIEYNAASKSVDFSAKFSSNVTDDNGNLLYSFSVADVAIITSSQSGGYDGGYYTGTTPSLKVDPNGKISFSLKTSEVESIAKKVASSAQKTQNYFRLYFTLVYSVQRPNGKVTKSSLIDLSGALADYGISAPYKAN